MVSIITGCSIIKVINTFLDLFYLFQLNNDNYLDKYNTIHVLTHRVRNYELREFIEDSIKECFDVIDNRK